jgi:hypothetical protein
MIKITLKSKIIEITIVLFKSSRIFVPRLKKQICGKPIYLYYE